ncbi:hypothetical protein EC912_11023 [Luteibacter rhizovicinus]|uniref:Beta-galactosidase-like protein n=1 Tax=Luteibacter rhizovicinus TaxID=242606 RepID=A0A4R3YLB4_9GAMM|nr:beta-agarase [Luteibacter rhizovicinus]TCV91593.1 hypothetical protein EC912_11023 [Luteibacter rhizovicinus]
MRLSKFFFVGACFANACCHAAVPPPGDTVVDLVHPGASIRIDASDASLDGKVQHAADGSEQVAATFRPAAAPSLTLKPTSGTWDWSAKGSVTLRVQNGMPWPVTLMVDIAGQGDAHLRTTVGIPPGPPQTLIVPLAPTSPRAFGMQVGPPMPFGDDAHKLIVATFVDGGIDTHAVTSLRLSMPQPGSPQTLLFGKLDAVAGDAGLKSAYTAIVDRYGQFTRATWPEKVGTDAELKERANAAPAASARDDLDIYGGRKDLAGLQRTGWFHTQKLGARWYLVTPEGHAFFSLGVNAVNATDGRTYVEGREYMFTDTKWTGEDRLGTGDSRSDKGSQRDNGLNHGRWWDIYATNITRTLGANGASAWRKRSIDRLLAWRFNTLGNWSDPALAKEKRIAYTVPILVHGDYNTVATGFDYWGRMPDPFDPRFVAAVRDAVTRATHDVRYDPWLLGYFADNELAWAGTGPQGRWALATGTLKQGPDSPAKQAFIAALKKTYGDDAGRFAQAWGLPSMSWSQLAAANFVPPDPSEAHPAVAVDYIAFLNLYADTYFQTVAQTLKKADPHHLFLGGRLAVRTPEVEAASAKWSDVTSINTYTDLPEHGFDIAAFRKMDKPVMITEFHFGSADRGPFGNGVAAVANEAERGKAYARFVDSAVASGVIVGTHWFQYVDQPVTGRILDGENAHIGLVGITDIPFGEFTKAVTEENKRATSR